MHVNNLIYPQRNLVPVKKQAHSNIVSKNIGFGANPLYSGPFNNAVIFSDFRDHSSNTEAELRLNDVLNHVLKVRENKANLEGFEWDESKEWKKSKTGILNIKAFSDIPHGNIDYSAFSMLRIASRPNKDVFVHVVDPGVGSGKPNGLKQTHDRSILVTKNHGILIGPNNGSLGLLAVALERMKEDFSLIPIDLKKVQEFEQKRLKNPDYIVPETFHGRDVFAVVAGAILGGIKPESFKDKSRKIDALKTDFAETAANLSDIEKDGKLRFIAFRDQTFGNLKTNLILTPEYAQRLKGAKFKVWPVDGDEKKALELSFQKSFSDVAKREALTYLGSTYVNGNLSIQNPPRFIEMAINLGNISQELKVGYGSSKAFNIKKLEDKH